MNDPFPWNERTSLVIYAAKSLDDNPDKSFPSLISHEYEAKQSGIIADGAPYLTALDATDMKEEIRKWKSKPFNDADHALALKSEKWVEGKIAEGWTHFLYETEPPKYAGNAYPWAKYQEEKGD